MNLRSVEKENKERRYKNGPCFDNNSVHGFSFTLASSDKPQVN